MCIRDRTHTGVQTRHEDCRTRAVALRRDPGLIRTGDLRFRKPPLYPPELRGRRHRLVARNVAYKECYHPSIASGRGRIYRVRTTTVIAMAKPKPTPPAVLVIEDDQDVAMTINDVVEAVSYTHLRAHGTPEHLVCRLLLE